MHAVDAIDPNAVPLADFAAAIARTGHVARLLELAREEDLGIPPRDPTGELMFDRADRRRVRLAARTPGVAAGLAFVTHVVAAFGEPSEPVSITLLASDGDRIVGGDALAELEGSARAIVRLERTMLNLTARLCGVATRTASFVQAIEGTGAAICDTRKTTPGMRLLEKYAVRCGGGVCHRLGLHDAVLIKDNHIAGLPIDELAGRLAQAATRARSEGGVLRFVQVEVDTLEQFDRVLDMPTGLIDMVLLDNMPPAMMATAVARRNERAVRLILEASGGVTLETVRTIAQTGVDRISVGGLTHQAVSLDLGLDVV